MQTPKFLKSSALVGLLFSAGLACPSWAAEITVPGPATTIDVIERHEFDEGQASDATDRAANAAALEQHRLEAITRETLILDRLDALGISIDGINDRLDALESGTPVPDPDPDPEPVTGIPQSILDLAPNTGAFFGAPVSDVMADLTPPTAFDRGNSYPVSMLQPWCGSAFKPATMDFIWTCGGHNDGNESPVLVYSVSELKPKVLAQSFKTPATKPDGSPVTNAECPRPRTWGDDKGPGGLHTYGGIKYRAADNSIYVAGGFPFTCNAIQGRLTDVQRFSLDTLSWSVVRDDITHNGGYSGGGSNSYDLQLLSDGEWMVSARHFVKVMNQDGEYIKHQGGADRLGFFNFTVKIGDRTDTSSPHDHFLAYDGSLNLRYMTAFHESNGIAIPDSFGKLPNEFTTNSAAAYVPDDDVVVFWDSGNKLAFVDLATNTVREAFYEFLGPGESGAKLGPGKLQYLGNGILVGISRWDRGLFAFRMPDDIDAVTTVPEAAAQPLQPRLDALTDGGEVVVPSGVWQAVTVRHDDFTIRCEPGAKIIGNVKGQGVILQEAANLTVLGCHVKAQGDIRGIWGGNGAHGLTAIGNHFEGGGDGILTCSKCGGRYVLEDNLFELGGKSPPGAGHGAYLSAHGEGAVAIVANNVFRDYKKGHGLKSRASRTEVRGNTFVTSRAGSRVMDFPPGGVVIVEGNTIDHNGDLGNDDVICWGCEAWVAPWPENSMTFKNNVVTCTGATSRFLNIHKASRKDAPLVFEGNTVTGCGKIIDDNRP